MNAKIEKYNYVFKTSIMDALVYVADFFGASGFFAFIMGIYLLLWRLIYSGSGETVIEGFSLQMMIWYLVMTEIVTLSTTNFYKEVSDDIKTGSIAYLLNKPYDYITYCFANNMGKTLIKMFVNIVVGSGVAILFVGPLMTIKVYELPFVFISLLLGICINYFINFSLALTAFWVEENMAFRWIFQKLVFTLGGMLLPLDLFPKWLAEVSIKLPFSYITYAPGKLFVDFSFDSFSRVVIWQLMYLMLSIIMCFGVYRRGVKKLNVNGG